LVGDGQFLKLRPDRALPLEHPTEGVSEAFSALLGGVVETLTVKMVTDRPIIVDRRAGYLQDKR
jgi:hypothetical protein